MDWLLFIPVLYVVFIGFFVVGKVDACLSAARKAPQKRPYVLLFGASPLACDLAGLFQRQHIRYLQIENEQQLKPTMHFTHLVAAAPSDLENLFISHVGGRTMNIPRQLLICNDPCDAGIFEKNNMPYLNKDGCGCTAVFHKLFPTKDWLYD